jgi:putative AlgH/UPF0301 family transcriptional regulator
MSPFGDSEEDDDEEDLDVSDQDWRAFRAKLVLGETSKQQATTDTVTSTSNVPKQEPSILEDGDLDGIGALFSEELSSTSVAQPDASSSSTMQMQKGMTPLDPSQWAYDSGKVIEQGAVILGGVEQDYGFGLRQQYFHKAAILVLDHDENTFTKGIILNRPSDLTLDDDINKGLKWRVWFGGDVQGLDSDIPDIVCLHTLKNSAVQRASVTVMNDIQWTTFEVAKKLVQQGYAQPTDFWLFCGYAGWGAEQLMGELERKSWYMVATDAQTLIKELARLSSGADPRDAGLDTWNLLMNMIGRSETAKERTGDFDDLMLKEWARKNLLSAEAGGEAGIKRKSIGGLKPTQELRSASPTDSLVERVSSLSRGEDVRAGTIVRASSMDRSPFLLDKQEFHKSIVLIMSDDEDLTVGVILNRPGAKGLEVKIQEKESGKNTRILKVPLRFGGQFAVKGSEPLLWLHCNPVLKTAKIGAPVGKPDGIWKCTSSDLITAVGRALATPEDFFVVTGVSVWTKGAKGIARGIQGEIREGHFEVVADNKIQDIWDELAKQEVLSDENLMKNLIIAHEAWEKGGGVNVKQLKNGDSRQPPIEGLGEAFEEEDNSVVFKSDVKVSKLSDDALRSWCATFLLGSPSL